MLSTEPYYILSDVQPNGLHRLVKVEPPQQSEDSKQRAIDAAQAKRERRALKRKGEA